MTHTNLNRGIWSITSAILVWVAALIVAPPASADQSDDAFLATLQRHGIVFANRDTAIATGHQVCTGLATGQTRANLALSLVKNTDLSAHEAGYFIGAAVTSYCLQYRTDSDNAPS
ncbi:DUF732 domain-containing protein [Mycobacterium intracellulare]|jgi:hypothetical protein|uniref:DUF732 domain-containing protein n=1 Tax=Mycobacterium intracellulare TaxID=1767 RepID=UPI000C7A208B|nr:DUF732 domain-containing protein [Mycobacterium intracellulare]